MSASEFKFQKGQRVVMPALAFGANIQAVVISRKSYINREPEYAVQFLSADIMREDGALLVRDSSFSESVLAAAQPEEFVINIRTKSKKK